LQLAKPLPDVRALAQDVEIVTARRGPRIAVALVYSFSLTRRRDIGQLHDRMAQDLVLRNFSQATRWLGRRECPRGGLRRGQAIV
jgi:hypothetical protein